MSWSGFSRYTSTLLSCNLAIRALQLCRSAKNRVSPIIDSTTKYYNYDLSDDKISYKTYLLIFKIKQIGFSQSKEGKNHRYNNQRFSGSNTTFQNQYHNHETKHKSI